MELWILLSTKLLRHETSGLCLDNDNDIGGHTSEIPFADRCRYCSQQAGTGPDCSRTVPRLSAMVVGEYALIELFRGLLLYISGLVNTN
jgi:hypothetical protein